MIHSLQSVLHDTIVVVVDQLQVVTIGGLVEVTQILVDVLSTEALPGHGVGVILQGGGANIDLAPGVAGDQSVVIIGPAAVSGVEDGLHQGLIHLIEHSAGLDGTNPRLIGLGLLLAVLVSVIIRDRLGVGVRTQELLLGSIRDAALGNRVTNQIVRSPLVGGTIEVDVILGVVVDGDGLLAAVSVLGLLGEILDLDLSALISNHVVAGVVHLVSNKVVAVVAGLDAVDIAALADIVQSGDNIQSAVAVGGLDAGLAGGQALVGVVSDVSELVGNHNALQTLQLQNVITQGSGVLAVAQGVGVEGHGLDQDGLEQDLSDKLTGGRLTKQSVGDVVGDAALLRDGSGANLPVAAGELVVLVVADGTQDHGQGLIPGNGIIGAKGLAVIALDVAGVGAVVDVASIPGAVLDVIELAPAGVDARLGILDVAGRDTVDDRGDLGTGDGALGLEGSAIVIALEHFQAAEDVNRFGIVRCDIPIVREGTGGRHQREAHDQSQYQCENLFQISHGGYFLLFIFRVGLV